MNKQIEKNLKFHKNNDGLSLVELIVAVVVLSIAIGPLLYTFVYSTRYNAQSKLRQRSTSAAQTVMENFKANDIEDVYMMFQPTSTEVEGVETTIYEKPFLANCPSAAYSVTPKNLTLYPKEIGTYKITNMTLSDVTAKDTAKYDAVITVDEGFKASSMPDLDVYDPTQDAVWQETSDVNGSDYYDPYYVATEIVHSVVVNKGISSSDITRVHITRNMHVEISAFNESNVFNTLKIYYEYVYKVYSDTNLVDNDTWTLSCDNYLSSQFGSDADKQGIRDIYYYYYPSYADTYTGPGSEYIINIESDNLVVTNTSGNDSVNIFVYKQLNSVKSFYDLATSEETYTLYCWGTGSVNSTNIYDCVQASLADISLGKYGTKSDHNLLDKNVGDTAKDKILIHNNEFGPVKTDVMTYNVTVTIYASGDTSDPLSTMSSTILKK